MLCGVGPCRQTIIAIAAAAHRALSARPFPKQQCVGQIHSKVDVAKQTSPPRRPNSSAKCQDQLSLELLDIINNLFHRDNIRRGALRQVRESVILSEYFLDRDKVRKVAETMAQTQYPQRALQTLLLAHKLGCPSKQNAYECVAFHLAEAGHWHLVSAVVFTGMRLSGRTTVRLLNWRARALVETTQFASLEKVTKEFERWNLKPNRATFHLLISGHIRNRDLSKAKKYVETMEKSGFPVDSSTHALIVSVYRSLGPDIQVQTRAFEALRDVGGRTATTLLNGLMQLRIDAHDFPGVLQVLSYFDQHHIAASIASDPGEDITPGGGGNSPLTQALLVSSLSNTKLDVATFSMLINYLMARGDAPRALTVFRSMVAIGVQPDNGVIASLVRLYFSMDDEATAVRIVANMCGQNTELSRLFDPLLSAEANSFRIPFPQTGLPLSAEVFNALLRGILHTRGLTGALTVLRIMLASNVKPDARTAEILFAYLNEGEQVRPLTLLRLLRILPTTAAHPTLGHVHGIMKSILHHEKHRRYGTGWSAAAANLLIHCDNPHEQRPVSDPAVSFDPIAGLDTSIKGSYRSLFRPIIQSLASRHIKSDRATIALRIRHEAVNKSDLKSARDVFRTMLARGLHPNEYHFSALMEGFAQNGDLPKAEAILESASRAGVMPNVVMFTILIVGYARQGNPESAMRTFQRMVMAGIKPDVPAIDAVTSAFFIAGAYRMAKRVLRGLWPYVAPFPKALRAASLRQLAKEFRALHEDNRGAHTTFTKQQRLKMHQMLDKLVEAWNSCGHSSVKKRLGARVVPPVSRTSRKLQNFDLR
jgi:pentatricopeptide repeat protein